MECSSFSWKTISPNQSGYMPGGLRINQPLSIVHKIWKYLYCGYDVRGSFLHNVPACDKIQHNDVVFKTEQNGSSGNLRIILQGYLDEQKERVVLNGQIFSWTNVAARVPLVQSLVECSF